MNKQEINEKLKENGAWCTECHTGVTDRYVKIRKAMELVGQLDEPKKLVVPKFVAEWIEYAKKKGDSLAISFKPWNLYGVEYSKVDRWIEDNQETFARAWLDGYEVEKIQKYIVKIGKLYLKEPLGDTSNSTILTTWDKKCAYPFSSFHMADKHADKFEGAVVEVVEG